ncbi:hypothetical protein CCAX7_64890 [Capsulimonas corticalis]|uniref:Uncharacterized protein n=1 Tax=Capsulimonas corticalis TaxID=2219043 RepID=A0A402CQV6_9BACT|nr:hypothetical protein [Capsulimonas corticalis]BDI34438.1 hypothetical protein CCAX7_64890 [Capsulimonas corticalis]
MATTKTAEKKPTGKKSGAQTDADPKANLANELLIARLHQGLVALGEPARISELVREIGDEAITTGLVRHTLETNPRRFVAVDRRWDVTQRYLDKQRPVVRTLEEIVGIYGQPMPVLEAATELGHIYGRVHEHFDQVAPRLFRGSAYFAGGEDSYGLSAWLLDIESPKEADVLFYNYLTKDSVAAFAAAAEGLDWESDPVGSASVLVDSAEGAPVDNRIVQYYAWKALGDDDFDGPALYDAMFRSPDLFIALPDHRWVSATALEDVRAEWTALAATVGESAEDLAPEVSDEPAAPLSVTEGDLAELQRYFADRDEVVTAQELLENVFEVLPGSKTFDADIVTLTEYLRTQAEDFIWVGTSRFHAPDTLPPYLGQVPESLTFPVLPRFETADGEILDQSLADDAFDRGLQDAILDPLAQDVNDQEDGEVTLWPDGVSAESKSLRLVLKSHHKEIGTFPLAQVPRGFFPAEPNIVEVTLRDASGAAYPVYVDYDVQLVYGLFDVYADIAADSGAVFTLEKTDDPAEFIFGFGNETDKDVYVNAERFSVLTDYRSEVEGGPVSTYDIVRTILEHHHKGASFLALLTEVNIVRRTPRRLLASILSGYTAFSERANRWTFDSKKEPEGFDKRKVEFILK